MILSIQDVARIASEAAHATSPALTVIGVTVTGGCSYSEILVSSRGGTAEPWLSTLGVFRDTSEAGLRAEIIATLRRQVARRLAE
jgi:hypothetical protein